MATIPNQRDPKTYAIIGAAMEVHRTLGPGFLEAVYQEALYLELNAHNVPTEREVEFRVHYKRQVLNTTYRADFVRYGDVIVETKAVQQLLPVHSAQLINYLKATGLHTGLLLNFQSESLEYKRYVL